MSTSNYNYWISLFMKKISVIDVADIRPIHIMDFLEYIKDTQGGKHPQIQAEKAVRQFVRFYSARGKMIDNLANIEDELSRNNVTHLANIDRNKDLVIKRINNPQRWTWRALGDYYSIHFTTARQIFLRDVEKYYPKKYGTFETI